MGLDDTHANRRLRLQYKKYLNPFMRTIWRLGLGKWFGVCTRLSGNILVLTHIGRKSGTKYHQPLNYALMDEDLYCAAAFGEVSDWYRNIEANPAVEVWTPGGWWDGTAEEVSDSPMRTQLIRQILISSGFAAYVSGLNPHKMTDEEIETAASHYRLVRIHRNAARTGPGGPGDLEWVWQLAVIALLGVVLLRRRRWRRSMGGARSEMSGAPGTHLTQ